MIARTQTSSMLQISGESGGGQLLRSALSLSMVTGQPFRMTNIRGKRPKPGLMRQHLTCVKAAAEVCQAAVDGADLGSVELVFSPGRIQAGDYAFNIGSGGSTTLVLQTLLPALLHAEGVSTLRIEGGTHNPMAPPFEFLNECFLPVLQRMGVEAEVALERHGFMQAGGGVLTATMAPMKKWKKLKLLERGDLQQHFGRVLHAHLHGGIAQREISTAAKVLDWPEDRLELRDANDSVGPGNALLLGARFANVCEISTGIAQMGKSAEAVATGAAKGLKSYLASEAAVGVHLADQLLLPLALAGGGEFTTLTLSNHVQTSMMLIESFLSVQFAVNEQAAGVKHIAVRPGK
ncbi:RNA 3'-terminal phosphate cyclase [Prosthecobacter dejongeii]|uniref:RNA 3'-terminal phosphate cyclase n=1 Tax=Prosthecobacter dejongeii TaxID=48465 RepID=A0A7W7YH33_9BACT|nr:RNA 3'-terminal phosphate cyclase [Prosthecobacter dejongeii]MBB5036086.1 RNA 3'-terminal phosphate cyclase (ATP) [Prosthecobacter dejongeii]